MAIQVDKSIQDLGVKQIKFYYKKCPLVGNIFTACLFLSEEQKILSRGVAICSIMDSHNKKEGRKIALRRAKRAIYSKLTSDKINPDPNEIFNGLVKHFKIKDEKIRQELITKIESIYLDYKQKDLPNGEKRIDVFVPVLYPLEETYQYFKFKSEFEPTPTNEEKQMFKLT